MLKRYSVVLIALVFMLASCASVAPEGAKAWTDMSPKEKSIFLMDLYGKQYDSYVALYKKPDRTEAEQEILEEKYKWINKVYPYIDAYSSYAESGIIAPAETEALMLELVNEALGI